MLWWLPTLLLAVAGAAAFSWSVRYWLGRARRMVDAGRLGEAMRVYAALERDVRVGLGQPRGKRAAR